MDMNPSSGHGHGSSAPPSPPASPPQQNSLVKQELVTLTLPQRTNLIFDIQPNQVSCVYSSSYNISFFKIEECHPFDSKKYERCLEFLKQYGIVQEVDLCQARQPSQEDLQLVHPLKYLKELNSSTNIATYTEMPFLSIFPTILVRNRVLSPMLYQTGGTVMAVQAAMSRGFSVNLGGGFHHACATCGGGFCIYADIPIAVQYARCRFGENARRVMIVDLDAHQGNGHERVLGADVDVYILDIFNAEIYPQDMQARKLIDLEVPLRSGTGDDAYITSVRDALEEAFTQFPDVQLVIYNAGTDILEDDPLGQMEITEEGVKQRDYLVLYNCVRRRVPCAMVLSGGYQKNNAEVIASSLRNLHTHFGIFNKENIWSKFEVDTTVDEAEPPAHHKTAASTSSTSTSTAHGPG